MLRLTTLNKTLIIFITRERDVYVVYVYTIIKLRATKYTFLYKLVMYVFLAHTPRETPNSLGNQKRNHKPYPSPNGCGFFVLNTYLILYSILFIKSSKFSHPKVIKSQNSTSNSSSKVI